VSAASVPASPGRVLATLVSSGLVDGAAACDGDVRIRDDSRSNPVYIVIVGQAPTFVVKQSAPTPDASSSLEAESAAYRWLAAQPHIEAVAPRAILLPDDRSWLVLETPERARTLHELLGALGDGLRTVVTELGRMLGTMHRASAQAGQPAELPEAQRPWLFDLPTGGSPDFAAAHEASRRVVAELRGRPDLMTLVRGVDAAWSSEALIHGDVKWDNVLARREPDGTWRLWLIDWELGGWGEPSWDIAALTEAVVTTSVLATGRFDESSVAQLCRDGTSAYSVAIGPALGTSAEQLVRAVAARLVQVVVQLAAMAGDGEIPPVTKALVQLATTIAADPPAWADRLLDVRR
jgi:Ser/Thr protein kinase RdoA (MazF antagonist)